MKVKALTNFKFISANKSGSKDDLSGSSTHSVDRDNKKRGKRRRAVSFNEKANQVHTVDTPSHDEVLVRWYTPDECAEMKEEFNFTCKTTIRSMAIVSQHAASATPQDSYYAALHAAYQACSQGVDLSDDEQAQLQKHLQQWVARVGLEPKLVKGAARDKKSRRGKLVDAIFALAQDDELLRRECEAISQPARLFALCVGRANAAAFHQ